MTHAPRRASLRAGGTLTGVLSTLAIIGALAATAAVVAPGRLGAGQEGPLDVPAQAARVAAHQKALENLAALVTASASVLAVHERGATPYAELLLWLLDDQEPGRIGEAELALLSHSRVMQTVTLYRLAEGETTRALGEADVESPGFCQRFRSDARVGSLVLVKDVSDMRLQAFSGPQGGLGRLWIELTWAGDSADGADRASVVVPAARLLAAGARPRR